MMLFLITLGAGLVGLFLIARGRLWAGIALPTATAFVTATYAAVERHVASVAASGASDPRSAGEFALQMTAHPIWLSCLVLLVTAGLVTGIPALRARVLGTRAMARAPRVSAVHSRSAPTNTERWLAAGRPGRAFEGTITPELLAPPSSDITGPLDEWLGSLSPNTENRRPPTEKLWAGLASTGFAGFTVPTEFGGLGLDPSVASTVVARAASHSIEVGEALAHSGLGGLADLIAAFGTDEQCTSWLPPLARGEVVGALVFEHGVRRASAVVVPAIEDEKPEKSTSQTAALEISLDAQAVEFAPIAGLFVAIVDVTDPDGVLGDVVELGPTVVMIPAETTGVRASAPYVAVASCTPRGAVSAVDATIPLSRVLGGPAAVGGGAAVRAYSRERRLAWAAPALASGVSQYAVRVACASHVVRDASALEGAPSPNREIGRLCVRAHVIEGLRRALAPRFMDVEGLDCGASLGCATKVAATRLAASVLEDAHAVVGERALFREPSSTLSGLAQYGRRLAHLYGSNAELEEETLAPGGAFLALDGLSESDALRAEDLGLFDAYRWRRNERIAAHVVRAFAKRVVPSRRSNVDSDVMLAFGALIDTYDRVRTRLDEAARACVDRDLGRALAGIVCLVARREVDRAGGDQPTERALRTRALEGVVEDVADALFRAGTLLGRVGPRGCRIAARAAARLTARRGRPATTYEDVAREVLEAHDVRSRLTSQVVVPGPRDPGLGTLDRAARLVLAARRPLARVNAARDSGQVSGDLDECIDRATELEIVSEVDRQNIRASRTSLDHFDSIRSGTGPNGVTGSERRMLRTG